jgi:putative membrane protein
MVYCAASSPWPTEAAMKDLVVHWIVSALLLVLVDHFVAGIAIQSFGVAMLAALVLGLLNCFVRPLLILVTLPITILTLGLFLFVVNALVLLLVASLVPGFTITTPGAALLGTVLLTLFNLVANRVLHGGRRRYN